MLERWEVEGREGALSRRPLSHCHINRTHLLETYPLCMHINTHTSPGLWHIFK